MRFLSTISYSLWPCINCACIWPLASLCSMRLVISLDRDPLFAFALKSFLPPKVERDRARPLPSRAAFEGIFSLRVRGVSKMSALWERILSGVVSLCVSLMALVVFVVFMVCMVFIGVQ